MEVTQTVLAERLQTTQAQISLWENGREPDLDTIRRIEEVLEPGRLKGWLLRQAGYVDDPTDLRSTIDAELDPERRRLVLAVLNSYEPGS